MNYEFSLKKSALLLITAGCVVFSLLLFGAGLVVGSHWLGGSDTPADATAKNQEAALPKEPVLNDEKAPAPKAAVPKTTAPPAPKAPTLNTAPTAADAAADTATQAEAASAANAEIQIIQEAAADPSNNDGAASEPEYVTVQIGVFLDEREADRLLKDVERKGYAPSFFSGRDAEARQWYAVRIGAYSDKQQAANAAANFTKQEKMKAVVRPLGSL
ncbi:MAG TPA: SPOR domain-containing protein [Pyrinomonadaceae bacterium]|nr:SPOR domain-containing protein [Pyrinomonadaceae bacterium]